MLESATAAAIKKEIDSVLKTIHPQSGNYIRDILVLISKEIGINKILSIILFGSQRPGNIDESCHISDCDLLIIFKDRVSDHHLKEIEKYFIGLEIKHNFRDKGNGLFKKILGVVQQTTGMFVSHFLTKRRYWEKAIFSKIFRVNKYISSLVAPKRIVLRSAIDNSSMLYGEDLRSIIKENVSIPHFDMIKSITMNVIISIFAIGILPFRRLKPMKYALESVKWALRASNYYSFEDSAPLEHVIQRFSSLEKSGALKRHAGVFYNRFLRLRKQPKTDIGFMLRCPFRILKIHVKGILFYKMLKADGSLHLKG